MSNELSFTVLCEDCGDRKEDLQQRGYEVAGACAEDEAQPGMCVIRYRRRAAAAAAGMPAARDATVPALVAESFGEPPATATQAGAAKAIVNLFETGRELAAANKRLELHLVGHSAGSILLGHFLKLASGSHGGGNPPLTVKTSTLYAAACSCAFANEHYGAAHAKGVLRLSDLWLYVLDDKNEKADGLPSPALPAYGKSLLYLVSRALDDERKMPLVGMHRALLAQYAGDADQWAGGQLAEVKRWQAAWPGAAKDLLRLVDRPQVTVTREGGQCKSTHGSFDNNIAALTETIERIKGGPVVAGLEWLDY